MIWRQGLAGLGRAVTGLLLGLVLLAYPGYLAYRASKLPAITDITTDPANPPRFDVLARLRPRGSSAYPGAQTSPRCNSTAYPDLDPLEYDAPAAAGLQGRARRRHQAQLAHRRRRAAGGRAATASIEAVARTLIMGFRDDVVVRVRAAARGSRIDVRSASRYGVTRFRHQRQARRRAARRHRRRHGRRDDARRRVRSQKNEAPKKRASQRSGLQSQATRAER